MAASDHPRIHPKTTSEWRRWLRDNHDRARGVWLVAFKASTGKARLSYEDSIPDALCYGWIDSVNKPLDDERTALLFTPRKAGSGWSRTNKVRIARLMKEGLIEPAGLARCGGRQLARAFVERRRHRDHDVLLRERSIGMRRLPRRTHVREVLGA